MIDVTDTFDAFHRVVALLWREFGPVLATGQDEDSVGFDEVVDQLELEVFLPACARRLAQATGEDIDPDEIPTRLLLVADTGEPLPGAAGRYHSHAFHPAALEDDVPNAILAANLMSVPRTGLRLQLGPPSDRRRITFRPDLPIH